MNIYYICSRYRGKDRAEIDKHIQYAKDLTREVLLHGNCAVTPHLYMTDCLDDSDQCERMLGLKAAIELLEKCDAVVVGEKYGISEGMEAEIAHAKKMNIPILYRERVNDYEQSIL